MKLASPATPDATLVQPWATRPDVGDPAGWGGRPCLMTPPKVTRVMLDATGEWLPLLAEVLDDRRIPWKKFELPATVTESETGPASEDIRLKLYTTADRAPQNVRVTLEGSLPRRVVSDTGLPITDVHVTDWQRAADRAGAMYDQQIDLVTRLYDRDVEGSDVRMFYDGPAGGVGVWPLSHVLHAWSRAADRNEPRPALIVKMAQTLGPLLKEICTAPRRQLMRQREYQTAGRVQEIDATCLRWLAKQPGVTVAEKAGAKQQAMGVTRVEHANTLENRIVRELMISAMAACERYLAENSHHRGHARIDEVSAFSELLHRLWAKSPLRTVPPIAGIPHPNYVLQHDPRYQPIWRAYVMLLKQNLQRHQSWRWRHRMFAESCSLAMLAGMGALQPVAAAMNSNVLVRGDARNGQFIDDRTAIGRWEVRPTSPVAYADSISPSDSDPDSDNNSDNAASADTQPTGRRVHFITQHQFAAYHSHASLPEGLGYLCPDAAIITYDAQRPDKPPKRILGIWTVFDFDLNGDRMADRCNDLDNRLRMIRCNTELRGVLIQPKIVREHDTSLVDRFDSRSCTALRLALPLQSQHAVFEDVLRETLDLK